MKNERYKYNKYNIQTMITDVDKKKIALVVILSLSGKARETALEIKTRPS